MPLFPVLEDGSALCDMRKAIANCKEFVELRRGGLICFDYRNCRRSTFPEPRGSRLLALRREARGLLLDAKTGAVVARRFHKFFNVGELPESDADNLDLARPHVLLEKLDGSLVTSFLDPEYVDQETGSPRLRFGTKKGINPDPKFTPAIEEFVRRAAGAGGGRYEALCRAALARGQTAIFEWLSPENQIKVPVMAPCLVLLALRCNRTGNYVQYAEQAAEAKRYAVPCVARLNPSACDEAHVSSAEGVEEGKGKSAGFGSAMDTGGVAGAASLVAWVRARRGTEGCVLRFEDDGGSMYKLKTHWWVKATGVATAVAKAIPVPKRVPCNTPVVPCRGGTEDGDEDEGCSFSLSELLPTEAAVWACIAKGEHDDVGPLLAPRERTQLHEFAEDFERRLSVAVSDWSCGVVGAELAAVQGKDSGQGQGKRAAKAKARARAKGRRRAAALLKMQHSDGAAAGPVVDPIARVRSELAAILGCSNARKRDDRLERVCRPLLGGLRWQARS